MEFDPWVKRMGASAETQTKLRAWLINTRDAVREFLSPRVEDDKLFFSLTEAIVIGNQDPKGCANLSGLLLLAWQGKRYPHRHLARYRIRTASRGQRSGDAFALYLFHELSILLCPLMSSIR